MTLTDMNSSGVCSVVMACCCCLRCELFVRVGPANFCLRKMRPQYRFHFTYLVYCTTANNNSLIGISHYLLYVNIVELGMAKVTVMLLG